MGGSNSSNSSNNEGDATRVQIMANVDPKILQQNKKLLKKQNLTNEEALKFAQKIAQDGVKMEDFKDKQKSKWFRNCGMCKMQYTQSYKPILLACGHFICQDCVSMNLCAASDCKNKPLVVHILSYWPYNFQFNANINSYEYRFALVNFGDIRPIQKPIPGNNTFKIFEQIYPEIFTNYTNKALVLSINGKTLDYGKCKDQTFNSFKKQFGGAIFATCEYGRENFCNKISKYQRVDGGF